jgi:hypothetical protein
MLVSGGNMFLGNSKMLTLLHFGDMFLLIGDM